MSLMLGSLAAHTPARSEEPAKTLDEKLQLGGLVTLDHNSGMNPVRNPDLELGEVALGANVTLSKELLASVLLKAEGDLGKIFFDQAVASLQPEGTAWTFLFGQQTFNHGLLSTRLISDPEILPYVELIRPGLSASYSLGGFAFGAGATVEEAELDGYTSRDYALLPNVDWQSGPLMLRASGAVSRYSSDADLGLSLGLGRVQMDAEAFDRLPVWDARERVSGYYLGAEISATSSLSFALRHDGVLSGSFSDLRSYRNAAGATFTLKHDLFAACEYSQLEDETNGTDRRIALQVGLKSTLELPGFQRKTLTQD
jgi:hypothetical protein